MTKINSRWFQVVNNIDANSKRITNAANGVDDSDYVTKRQLIEATSVTYYVDEFTLDSSHINTTKSVTLTHLPIDDRSVKFDGDYSQLFDDLKEFQVYWRKNTKSFDKLESSEK